MHRIICDISGMVHEYAGEGRWVREGGLRFDTHADAEARLIADSGRINPRIRPSIRIESVPAVSG